LAKHLKLTIKNAQIAEAINLGGLKEKLASKKAAAEPQKAAPPAKAPSGKAGKGETTEEQGKEAKEIKEEAPRIRARSKSAFAEPHVEGKGKLPVEESITFPEQETPEIAAEGGEEAIAPPAVPRRKTSEELRKEIFGEDLETYQPGEISPTPASFLQKPTEPEVTQVAQEPSAEIPPKEVPAKEPKPAQPPHGAPQVRLGPTGKHIKDLLPAKQPEKVAKEMREAAPPLVKPKEVEEKTTEESLKEKLKGKPKPKGKGREGEEIAGEIEDLQEKKGYKVAKFKEFRDIKPAKRQETTRTFDARDRHGLRDTEEEQHWRKKRAKPMMRQQQEDVTIRPTHLKIRIPISIKDLAAEMKLKASQLIAKLFMQGVAVTLNDLLEDETTIQLLGQEFGCEIAIDTTEEERIRVTDKTIKEEIQETNPADLKIRPPVVAFMGHVDHGKTTLIDAIRKSNRAAAEAGAITQHIGAFRCSTPVGDIAILDTPGHEAFSAMRARGADVTDIVVLVIAGDEGMRQQTIEALQHAKAANVSIVVALNKSDKPNFNAEMVYRQLAEHELLPELWGGQTITVNCSAVTNEGIPQLLEMLALQAEVLELKASLKARARGTVLESEMHKGMGAVATVLVQNGTLKRGDALVFGQFWGRVKTMHDEYNRELQEAGPSTPVEITGLSGLPEAGQEFIVVKSERDAREISEARTLGIRQFNLLQTKKFSMENLFQQASDNTHKKILNIVLRADVQGSLEALKAGLLKIESKKAELNIIFAGVGEVSESDVQLAAASKAVIIGFHTQIESHAEAIVKQLGIQVRLHDIIYHAIDDVKGLLGGLLDKIAQETDMGKAEVKATFKSSHFGVIAGCLVIEGVIHRSHSIRVNRGGEIIWKGTIASLKRVKEDVREVPKGLECGIVLSNFNEVKEGDILESYEITYISQEL
jgi:translation initiation factor IF-2